jgi:hypothetical protein
VGCTASAVQRRGGAIQHLCYCSWGYTACGGGPLRTRGAVSTHARRCTPSGHHTRAHGALRTPTRKTHRLPTGRCAQTDDDVATRHTRPCVMIVRRPWLLMVAWLYSSLAIPIDKPAELPALEGPSEFQVAGRWVALLPAHGCTTAGVWQDLDHVCLTAPAASRECRLLVEGEGWLAESPHGAATAGAETAHVHAGAAAAVLPCMPLRKTPLPCHIANGPRVPPRQTLPSNPYCTYKR